MSFLEKLKKGIGVEEESVGQEDFEGEETSSLLPPRSARETEELKKPSQPKKQVKKTKKIKAEEKFLKPQEEIPKEVIAGIKAKAGSTAAALLPPKEKKWPEPEGQLAVDVYQTDNELVIQSTIAGIKPEDLDITAQEDTVIIRGKREKIETEERNYFYQECYWGPFSREIILPVEADASRAEASMVEGVLTIRMPKIEREKKKKIVVKER